MKFCNGQFLVTAVEHIVEAVFKQAWKPDSNFKTT